MELNHVEVCRKETVNSKDDVKSNLPCAAAADILLLQKQYFITISFFCTLKVNECIQGLMLSLL